jgi:anti-anti-sigma factor
MGTSAHLEDRYEPDLGGVLSCIRLDGPRGGACLMLVGELDLVTAGRARTVIRRAQDETTSLTCDLGDVWFVDVSGLRVLIDAAAHARRSGRRFALANCPPIVPRMLALLRLDGALDAPAARHSAGGGCARFRPHVS